MHHSARKVMIEKAKRKNIKHLEASTMNSINGGWSCISYSSVMFAKTTFHITKIRRYPMLRSLYRTVKNLKIEGISTKVNCAYLFLL